MILSQFASRLSGHSPTPKHILQASRARGWGGKMAQKGDFAVAGSFAIASVLKKYIRAFLGIFLPLDFPYDLFLRLYFDERFYSPCNFALKDRGHASQHPASCL